MFADFPFRFDHPIDGSYTVTKYGFQATPKMPQPRDIIRIIRIIRIASKPKKAKKAKGDRDVTDILAFAADHQARGLLAQARRLRAIARRLENMP